MRPVLERYRNQMKSSLKDLCEGSNQELETPALWVNHSCPPRPHRPVSPVLSLQPVLLLTELQQGTYFLGQLSSGKSISLSTFPFLSVHLFSHIFVSQAMYSLRWAWLLLQGGRQIFTCSNLNPILWAIYLCNLRLSCLWLGIASLLTLP